MGTIRWIVALVLVVVCLASNASADPEQTVQAASTTLAEIMAIPASSIPQSLLADAQGVAIIPNVIKIGFVAGVRRGHGVVLVREPDGGWSLPQFITLTGGSVGWQAGVSGTDVVLVFMTKKSVEGLTSGKFTIGADASAAAGPVGRTAAAATDARLRAEILSYSRSRGLFVGLALDGSAIEVDTTSQAAYYGTAPAGMKGRVPESAVRLISELGAYASGASTTVPPPDELVRVTNEPPLELRGQLAASSQKLSARVDDRWRSFLALPPEVYQAGGQPSLLSVERSLEKFDQVRQDARYRNLVELPEFVATYDLLRSYVDSLASQGSPRLALPPPPTR